MDKPASSFFQFDFWGVYKNKTFYYCLHQRMWHPFIAKTLNCPYQYIYPIKTLTNVFFKECTYNLNMPNTGRFPEVSFELQRPTWHTCGVILLGDECAIWTPNTTNTTGEPSRSWTPQLLQELLTNQQVRLWLYRAASMRMNTTGIWHVICRHDTKVEAALTMRSFIVSLWYCVDSLTCRCTVSNTPLSSHKEAATISCFLFFFIHHAQDCCSYSERPNSE